MTSDVVIAVVKITGFAGACLIVFYFVLKLVIDKNIFPTLTKKQSYNIFLTAIYATFIIVILGIFVYSRQMNITSNQSDEYAKSKDKKHTKNQIEFKRMEYQEYSNNESNIPPTETSALVNSEDNPILYIISIGIEKYQAPNVHYDGAATAALDLNKILKNQDGNIYKQVRLKSLIGRGATKKNIINEIITALENAENKDSVIIYLSCLSVFLDEMLILPYDFDIEDLHSTAVKLSLITYIVNKAKPAVVFMFDSAPLKLPTTSFGAKNIPHKLLRFFEYNEYFAYSGIIYQNDENKINYPLLYKFPKKYLQKTQEVKIFPISTILRSDKTKNNYSTSQLANDLNGLNLADSRVNNFSISSENKKDKSLIFFKKNTKNKAPVTEETIDFD